MVEKIAPRLSAKQSVLQRARPNSERLMLEKPGPREGEAYAGVQTVTPEPRNVGKRQYAANGWPSAAVLTPNAADDSAPDAVVHRAKDAKPK